jgi:lysophospholipase L1-like esterase
VRFERRRLRRLALFGAIVAAQFGVFEAGLRRWGSSEAAPSFQGLFMPDPDVGFRLKPGARIRFETREFSTDLAINNAGIRDDEDLAPKRRDERRVVVLGDSLVMSVQVPQRSAFPELLERRLNQRHPFPSYRVLNAGVQGYGPVQELLWFRKFGAALEPDLVIVTVFVANDAEDAYASRLALNPEQQSRQERLREALTITLRRMVRQSMVLQILRARANAVTAHFRPRATAAPPYQSYAANPMPWVGDGFAIAVDCVRRIAAHAETLGARTMVVLMPARFQLDDGDYGRLRRVVADAHGELVRDAASERFATALSGLGLPVLDLLPVLRSAGPGADLFFQYNVHLTPRGHEIVADALDAFLDRQAPPEPAFRDPGR